MKRWSEGKRSILLNQLGKSRMEVMDCARTTSISTKEEVAKGQRSLKLFLV
jgi:hypothetical protein